LLRLVVAGIAAATLLASPAFAFDNTEPLANKQWYITHDEGWSYWPTLPKLFGVKVAVIDTGIDGTHPDLAGRVIMAQALSANFGRDALPDERLIQLCKEGQLKRAHCWGEAMRLGQRLSGGVGSVLKRTSLAARDGMIELSVRRGEEALIGDQVERRFVRLAEVLGCKPVIVSV